MSGIPRTAVPAEIGELQRGYRGDYPKHLVPVGGSPELRNVLCGNKQVVAHAGFTKVTNTAPNGKRVRHIFQVFRTPFDNADVIGIQEEDEINVWLPDANSGAGGFQDITPDGFTDDEHTARSTSTLDHDGNLILATGQGVYWWPLGGYEPYGIGPATVRLGVTSPFIYDSENPFDAFVMIALPGLDDERVNITKAWVASHFEPHVLLGRLYQDEQWYVNRYAWSDTNASDRWFPGFDEGDEETPAVTSVAGFADLPADVMHETPQILAMHQLRDLLIIYTDWNIWTLQFVGAPLMWVRRMVQSECGIGASGTIVSCGDRHYFYGRDGRFWEFNGADKQPIGKPIEDFVNRSIQGTIFGFRRFYPDSVVWAFSTDPDNTGVPDTAVAFNRVDGSWTIEDFPFTAARSVDASGIADPVGAALTYDDLDAGYNDYDELDAAFANYSEMDIGSAFTDTSRKRVDVEVMGSDDGHIYWREGWTNDGEDRTHVWRSGVLDFGEPLVVKHLTAIEIDMVKEGLTHQNVGVPVTNYPVQVNVYASDIRERCGLGTPAQTQRYRPGTDEDPLLWFRVSARYIQVEVKSESSGEMPKPWAVSKLVCYLIPMGTR